MTGNDAPFNDNPALAGQELVRLTGLKNTAGVAGQGQLARRNRAGSSNITGPFGDSAAGPTGGGLGLGGLGGLADRSPLGGGGFGGGGGFLGTGATGTTGTTSTDPGTANTTTPTSPNHWSLHKFMSLVRCRV